LEFIPIAILHLIQEMLLSFINQKSRCIYHRLFALTILFHFAILVHLKSSLKLFPYSGAFTLKLYEIVSAISANFLRMPRSGLYFRMSSVNIFDRFSVTIGVAAMTVFRIIIN